MTYNAKAELLRQKSEKKKQGLSCQEIEQRLIFIDRIPKKSKKPRVITP